MTKHSKAWIIALGVGLCTLAVLRLSMPGSPVGKSANSPSTALQIKPPLTASAGTQPNGSASEHASSGQETAGAHALARPSSELDKLAVEVLLGYVNAANTPGGQPASRLSHWRRTHALLDDVYTVPAVSAARRAHMSEYLALSDQASQQQDWPRRRIMRDVARAQLQQCAEQMEQMMADTNDASTRQECELAVAEMRYKAGEYAQALDMATSLVGQAPSSHILAQAQYYVIQSYTKSGNADAVEAHMTRFVTERPAEARGYYGGAHMKGRDEAALLSTLRIVANNHETAEQFDDMRVQYPKDSSRLVQLRDNQTAMADAFLRSILGG